MAAPLIVVVGSVSMTLVTRIPALPTPGRSVVGTDLRMRPGGRGATQAVAAARLGASVHLVGRVGSDDFGSRLLASLDQCGVNTSFVTISENAATGTTLALEDETIRQDACVHCPGANQLLTPEDVDRAQPLLRTAAAVLLQLEVPLETVEHTRALCHRFRVPVLLDPSPLPPEPIPKSLLDVTCLTPDEQEAGQLLGRPGLFASRSVHDPKQVLADLCALGPRSVAMKWAEHGSLYACAERSRECLLQVPAFKVKAADPTGAGDAFTAALAVAMAESRPPAEALRFANAAGALACTHEGAFGAMPHRSDVEDLCKRWS
ncbi:MAG: ribokinase [Tepidisphaerales bacterium]